MAEIVFGLVLIFPAMLGLAEILHTVKMFLLSSSRDCKKTVIIFPDDVNFHKQLMKIQEEKKWQGEKYAERIFVSDENISEKNREELRKLAEKYGFEIYN